MSNSPGLSEFVLIMGETTDGKKFRPSDWCDRLHSTLRALEPEEYEECVEYVHLVSNRGQRGILIDSGLKEANPPLYNFFMKFVESNQLTSQQLSKADWHEDKARNGG